MEISRNTFDICKYICIVKSLYQWLDTTGSHVVMVCICCFIEKDFGIHPWCKMFNSSTTVSNMCQQFRYVHVIDFLCLIFGDGQS